MARLKLNTIYNILFEEKFSIENLKLQFETLDEDIREKILKDKKIAKLSALGINDCNHQLARSFIANNCGNIDLIEFLFDEPIAGSIENTDHDISNNLASLNHQYGYEIDFITFKKFYQTCLYIAQVLKTKDLDIYICAYKLIVLFGPDRGLSEFDKFIAAHGSNLEFPMYSIYCVILPNRSDCHIETWRILLKVKGVEILHLLAKAKIIENRIKISKPKFEWNIMINDKIKINLLYKMIQDIRIDLKYKHANKNKTLAKIYYLNNVRENVFDRTLHLIQNKFIILKSKDNLPDVIINLEQEVHEKLKGLYMIKLPFNNLRGLILGEIVFCCQSISGSAEECAVDGMSRENNGFYILIKSREGFNVHNINWDAFEQDGHQIIGQGYAWISKHRNIVFDSWENLRPDPYDKIIHRMLKVFGDKVLELDATISRVVIGQGGGTPKYYKEKECGGKDDMLEGCDYGDTEKQIIISESNKLKDIKESISKLINFHGVKVISTSHGKRLINILSSIPITKLTEIGIDALNTITSARFIDTHDDLECIKFIQNFKFSHHIMNQLFSDTAIKIYNLGVNINDVYNDNMSLFLSETAYNAYNLGIRPNDLKNLTLPVIMNLISDNALTLYARGISINNLKNLPLNIQKILTSTSAMIAYNDGANFYDLRNYDYDKICTLISLNAIEAYRQGVEFNDLKELSNENIRFFLQPRNLNLYTQLNAQRIDLTSKEIFEIIINGSFINMVHQSKSEHTDIVRYLQ